MYGASLRSLTPLPLVNSARRRCKGFGYKCLETIPRSGRKRCARLKNGEWEDGGVPPGAGTNAKRCAYWLLRNIRLRAAGQLQIVWW